MGKKTIINLSINNCSFDQALDNVSELGLNRTPSYVCFVNAHMTVEANEDDYMMKVVNSAEYAFADGAPVAKLFKVFHKIDQERIAGMDFFPRMLHKCNEHKFNIGLLGSTTEVIDLISKKIKCDFSDITITNAISPPFNQEWDNQKYIQLFNKSSTNIIFVALGCPKQEKWMYENYKELDAVLLGVGGAFPVYADVIKRSPEWMRKNGLEWLYRLLKEPRRMFKRYFYTNSIFIKLLFGHLLFKKIKQTKI